ncbi:unnamed protein product [Mytilus coruscus]|uniref:Uncharacterized protein n=1 Tax=Mytilus coruscus TaxID=42192 RepID=A0A6J8EVR7_MYTCO|nr:unnamed protein product [Mytilus coruscus]
MNPPEVWENKNFGNSSVATSVLNDVEISTEKSCLAKFISDVVKENVTSCELNPKFCVAKIRGLVNEKSVLILVDTGSTVSIVLIGGITSLHESIQETPFFIMHGRDPVLPVEAAMCPPTITYTSSDDYKSEMVTRLQEAFTLAKDNLQAAQRKQK